MQILHESLVLNGFLNAYFTHKSYTTLNRRSDLSRRAENNV